VVGRALTFADAAVIKMAREDFVPVAGDDWYQRRRQDDEGKFFRGIADQGPRKGEGGSTRQGIYMFTASGKLLGYRNHHDPSVMRDELSKALTRFRQLPASERRPNAVKIDEPAKIDPTYHREPPKGGLVVTVFTRILDREEGGDYRVGTCSFRGGDKAARDHLWLTAEECASLVAGTSKVGEARPLPERLAYRIARFHLVDNTRGEPDSWRREDLRKYDVKLTLAADDGQERKYLLEGTALLASDRDPAKAERGYEVRLLGYLHYHPGRQAISRFDVVALGEHWGQGRFTRGARPGRTPLGIAFELARGDRGADRVAPQGARVLQGYMHAEK
jgi:hypothetical protein